MRSPPRAAKPGPPSPEASLVSLGEVDLKTASILDGTTPATPPAHDQDYRENLGKKDLTTTTALPSPGKGKGMTIPSEVITTMMVNNRKQRRKETCPNLLTKILVLTIPKVGKSK